MDAKLNGKIYTITVNTIQAAILLIFNIFKENEVSLQEISQSIGIPNDKELKLLLIPLLTSRIIIKANEINSINNTPSSQNTLSSDDKIKLNQKFTFNSRKIKINYVQKNDEIIRKEKIEDDRSVAVEANIIRIMKSTQRIHHNELVKKVLDQLDNFRVQIQIIKKKIDNLIDRELIKRDKEDANYYLYSTN